MDSSPRQRRKPRPWRRSRRRSTRTLGMPWGWMFLTALAYLAVGTLMGAFPIPLWTWAIAVIGIVAQAAALAGPQSLSAVTPWWRANALVLLAIVGALAVAIAVGIAVGFVGTDQLDDISFSGIVFEIIRVGLVALFIPAAGAMLTATTGDRLRQLLTRLQAVTVVAATSLLGLGLGCAIGLFIRG